MVTAGHIDDDHRVRRLEKTMILVQIVMVHFADFVVVVPS